MGMYGSRAVTLLVLISDAVINRILKLDIQTNILVYVTRCCTDLTSKVLKERTFGQSSAVLNVVLFISWHTKFIVHVYTKRKNIYIKTFSKLMVAGFERNPLIRILGVFIHTIKWLQSTELTANLN